MICASFKTLRYGAVLLGGLVLGSTMAYSAPITGTLNISGSVAVSATTIDWLPSGTGVGSFSVDEFTQEGYFATGTLPGSGGTSRDLVNPGGGGSDVVGSPFNTSSPFTAPAFLTFAADPNVVFHLQFINPGVFSSAGCTAAPAAAGQTCTPDLPPGFGDSPFNMSNTTATSSAVTFQVGGQVENLMTGELSPFIGTYSTQFVSRNFQQLLATINAGGSVSATYSANFIVGVPEPGTWLTMGFGSLLFILGRKRFSR